jgi:hypothetical protein
MSDAPGSPTASESSATTAVAMQESTQSPLSLRTRLNVAVPEFVGRFSPMPLLLPGLLVAYSIYQAIVRWLFAPPYSGRVGERRGRVAVIGAGLTGVSSAAHLVDAGV